MKTNAANCESNTACELWRVLTCVALLLTLAAGVSAFDHELKVHTDDSIWETLQKEREASEKETEAFWKKRSIEDFEKNGNVFSSVVRAVRELPKEQQDALKTKLDRIPKLNHAGKLLLLNAMGDAAAGEEIVRLLKTADDDVVLIDLLRGLWHEEWQRLPVSSGKLPELLLDVSQRSGKRIQSFIYRELEQIPAKQWQERLMKLAGDRQYKARPEALGLLLKNFPDSRLIPMVGESYRTAQPADNIYTLAGMLETLAANPQLKSAAADELVKCIESKGVLEASSAVTRLCKIDPERSLPFAELLARGIADAEVLPANLSTWPALDVYAQKKKMGALPVLKRCLRHEKLRETILLLMAVAVSGTCDPEIGEMLWREIQKETAPTRYLFALLAVGGDDARKKASTLASKVPSYSETGYRWALLGWSAEDAMERCVKLGLVSKMPSKEAFEASRTEWGGAVDPFLVFSHVLQGLGYAAGFDTETGTFPNRHDLLIAETLVMGSAGRFKVEKSVEAFVSDGEFYKVAFKSGGKWFQFKAEHFGDWYDVYAVQLAVNRALQESNVEERFFSMPTGGQDSLLVIAKPKVFDAVCKELMIPVAADANEARRLGKEFEETVRRQLEQK